MQIKRLAGLSAMAAALAVSGWCGGTPAKSAASGVSFTEKLSGTITVSAFQTWKYKGFLEEAARVFQKANPGTTVKIETFSPPGEYDTSALITDYIRRVNTSLMSGSGADLYDMDVLPLDKMVESGQLENLEPYMSGDPNFRPGDYRKNIFDAVRYRNGTWFLPLDYQFMFYAYDSALVPSSVAAKLGPDKAWTAINLLDMGKDIYNGQNRLFNMNIQQLFEQAFLERYNIYIDMDKKRANFVNGGFAQMLGSVSDYEKKGYIIPRLAGQASDALQTNRETDKYVFSHFTNEYLLFFGQGDFGLGDFKDYKAAGIAMYEGGNISFSPGKSFAVNSASKNKALAWAFLKFLLSKETALSGHNEVSVLPVHNEARREKAELLFSDDGAMDEQTKRELSEYLATSEAMSDQINAYFDLDMSAFRLMTEPLSYWLDGSRTAAEVTALIQSRVDLYLSE